MINVDLIKQNIKTIKSSFFNRKKQNDTTKKLKQMAYESWTSKIPRMPGEPANKDKRTIAPDILGYLLRSFSYLYRSTPTRSAADPGSGDVFQKKLWNYNGGIDASLLLTDQLTRISGSCLVGVDWTPSPDGSISPWGVEDGYILHIYTSEEFGVLEGDNPLYPEAVIVKTKSGWEYWDSEVTADLSSGWDLVIQNKEYAITEHNFGIIPFCLVQNIAAWPTSFAPRMGGDDLYETIRNLGAFIRELGWTAILQRGQPYITGDPKDGLMIGPDVFIKLENGGSFGIAPSNANLDGMVTVLETLLNTLATSLGLPSRIFKIERSSAMSGVAIQLDQQELEADRQNRTVVFNGVEQRIARIVAFLEVKSARKMASEINPNMMVRFRQPEPILSFSERKNRVDWMYSNKLCDPLFAISELYPSATKEEVQKIYEDSQKYWTDNTPDPVAPTPPASDPLK